MVGSNRGTKYDDLGQSWERFSSSEDETIDTGVGLASEDELEVPATRPIRIKRGRNAQVHLAPQQSPTRPEVTKDSADLVMPMLSSPATSSTYKRVPTRASPDKMSRAGAKNVGSKLKTRRKMEQEPSLSTGWATLFSTLGFVGRTVGGSMYILQPLFSIFLAMAILWLGFRFALGAAGSALRDLREFQYVATAPICAIPGLSKLPFCPPPKTFVGDKHPEFDKLMKVQADFDEVLESSAMYAALPMDLKRTEMSIRDLKHIVLYSNLPSRQELGLEFETFVETARQAGWDLTKFNSAIGRTMDQILSTNRWTIQVIEGVNHREAEHGVVSRFFYKSVPAVIGFRGRNIDEFVLEQYLKHTGLVEDQITQLVLEAQALLAVLDHMDNQLDVIASVVARDGISVSQDRDKLFGFLWTKLGGNRSSVKKLDEQIQLLNDVTGYRRVAWAHVNQALLKLQEIQAGLIDLKGRVALPETVGLDMPLSQHIEIIRLGVERLEDARRQQKTVENAKIQRFIGTQRDGEGLNTVQGTAIMGR